MSETTNPLDIHPKPDEGHPVIRQWKHWYPGKVGFANERGHTPGCAFVEFPRVDGKPGQSAAEQANEFFTLNPGLLIVECGFSEGRILIAYSKILSEEEYRENDDVYREVRELLDKRKAEREAKTTEAQAKLAEIQAKAAEEQAAELKELKRLAELGKRHEKNCAKKAAKEEAPA